MELEPTSYEQCLEIWGTRKRKLGNNTYLTMCENGPQFVDGLPFYFAIKLHATEVVIFHREGNIELQSGGWLSVTTKDRMNRCLKRWNIYSVDGIWYVREFGAARTVNSEPHAYADGITLHPDGTVTGEGADPKAALKLRRRIRAYARDYMDAFWRGEVPAPSGGDCWACCIKATDGTYPLANGSDHILEHLKESYFVPTLLSRAVERFPVSKWAMHTLACYWNPEECERRGIERPRPSDSGLGGVADSQLRKSLQRFLFELTGTAS